MARRRTATAATPPASPIRTILEALNASEPRPAISAEQGPKGAYGTRFSRNLATCVANGFRSSFSGILPREDGSGQESAVRSRRSLKKLDVNYSTVEMGLGLGVSIKTINYPDAGSDRYTKNQSRNDNELRAEATDYHIRQPYAVLAAIVFLPIESADDGGRGGGPDHGVSSFATIVNYFRMRAGRRAPTDDVELFERVFVGLYHHQPPTRGEAVFFDVLRHLPPRARRPRPDEGLTFVAMLDSIRETYDARNNPPPVYAPD